MVNVNQRGPPTRGPGIANFRGIDTLIHILE